MKNGKKISRNKKANASAATAPTHTPKKIEKETKSTKKTAATRKARPKACKKASVANERHNDTTESEAKQRLAKLGQGKKPGPRETSLQDYIKRCEDKIKEIEKKYDKLYAKAKKADPGKPREITRVRYGNTVKDADRRK